MKYVKIAECSPVLLELIEISNLIPLDDEGFSLPGANELIDDCYHKHAGTYPPSFVAPNHYRGEWKPPTGEEMDLYGKAQVDAEQEIQRDSKPFPKFYKFLFGDFKYQNSEVSNFFSAPHIQSMFAIGDTLRKYDEAIRLKSLMTAIAKDCQNYVENKVFPNFTNRFFTAQRTSQRSFQTILFITKENKITFFDDLFVKELEGVDAKRLRICPLCKNVFWAKRIEARACSKKCSDNIGAKKKRIEEHEKELCNEFKILEKHQSTLSPGNTLIADQKKRIEKLENKIKREKAKNGTV